MYHNVHAGGSCHNVQAGGSCYNVVGEFWEFLQFAGRKYN